MEITPKPVWTVFSVCRADVVQLPVVATFATLVWVGLLRLCILKAVSFESSLWYFLWTGGAFWTIDASLIGVVVSVLTVSLFLLLIRGPRIYLKICYSAIMYPSLVFFLIILVKLFYATFFYKIGPSDEPLLWSEIMWDITTTPSFWYVDQTTITVGALIVLGLVWLHYVFGFKKVYILVRYFYVTIPMLWGVGYIMRMVCEMYSFGIGPGYWWYYHGHLLSFKNFVYGIGFAAMYSFALTIVLFVRRLLLFVIKKMGWEQICQTVARVVRIVLAFAIVLLLTTILEYWIFVPIHYKMAIVVFFVFVILCLLVMSTTKHIPFFFSLSNEPIYTV